MSLAANPRGDPARRRGRLVLLARSRSWSKSTADRTSRTSSSARIEGLRLGRDGIVGDLRVKGFLV